MLPYFDKEEKDFGRWFGDTTSVRITAISAYYSAICCILLLALSIGFNWPDVWLGEDRQLLVLFINPGTILILLFTAWSIFVLNRYHSTRLTALSLFSCFFVATVVLTYFAWGHRGPNWDFYWWLSI
ncbi:MAG: hypothetical protein DRH26_12395 [Deltaproteobacteria bacterium]|nr:MAG: hypothetical protein DRH26_12395 [Deltaproteobacteria bacterium]